MLPKCDTFKCHQRRSFMLKMYQNRWRPGRSPGPAGGAHDAPPDPLVDWGGGKPPPQTPPPRRLRRLDPRAYGARPVHPPLCSVDLRPWIFLLLNKIFKSGFLQKIVLLSGRVMTLRKCDHKIKVKVKLKTKIRKSKYAVLVACRMSNAVNKASYLEIFCCNALSTTGT
jgi:hypothetical protein